MNRFASNRSLALLLSIIFLYSYIGHSQAIGTNDFRISDMGVDGDASIDGQSAASAYNSATNQYLVVWRGDDATGEDEIYGQFINAATGAEIGVDFRISDMGPDGDDTYDASNPAVVYNATDNQFLVVWDGDDNTGGLVEGEDEIWGQLLSSTGAEIGADFRISQVAGNSFNGDGTIPDVAWNSTDNEYLVVWHGDDNTLGQLGFEMEIFVQRLSNTGAEIGGDTRISDMSGIGLNWSANAYNPDVAYNPTNNEYMVVWQGAESSTVVEYEIYAQRLSNTAVELGSSDFVISDMGPAANADYDASYAAITYNATNNEYLVVWQSDDNTAPAIDKENEIWGQRLSNTGAQLGTNDFRISSMGDDGELIASERDNYTGSVPAVAWDVTTNLYMVVWKGEDDTEALLDGEGEIFAQIITNVGALTGSELRISDMGPARDIAYDANNPVVSINSAGQCLIAWQSDNDIGTLVDNENEIWGQRFTMATGNHAPEGIVLDPDNVDDGVTTPTKVSDILAIDMDLNNTWTYTLVAGAGDTDNGSFTISGSDLLANTTFDFASQAIYFIRIRVNDGFSTYDEQLTVTVNPPVTTLVGSNFAVSDAGPASDQAYDAAYPDVAFNSTADEFLVVWHADDNLSGKNEIYGQRIRASDGAELGADFLIGSQQTGNTLFYASDPAVAYNSTNNQFLVVWNSDDLNGGMVDNENEIFGQIVNGNGTLSGANFRISDAGGSGNSLISAVDADVAYNATSNEYLVVWESDDNAVGLLDNEYEIFGQRISAAGAEVGTNDFFISDNNGTGNADLDQYDPSVVWNSADNQYLVVWDGEMVNLWQRAYGQLLTATGTDVGSNFEIMAGASDANDVDVASVTYNSSTNQYLVVCDLDDPVDAKNEIYSQLVTNAGALSGSKVQVSDLVAGNANFDQVDAAVAYLPVHNEFIVAWRGESNLNGLTDNEFEIHLQRLDATNTEVGDDDERISQNGGTGNANFDAYFPSMAYSPTSGHALIVWYGDDNSGSFVDNENEIWGQLWKVPVINTDPTISVIGNQTSCQDVASSAISFTIGDAETATTALTLSGSSSNQTIVQDVNVVFGGAAASRTVTITPEPGQSGTVTITIIVTDAGGLTASTDFDITITASENATFNYSASAYCVTDADPTPTIGGTSGGTFSSAPAGLNIISGTGVIDVSASSPGTYTVTYTTPGTCFAASNVLVTINALDDASFSYSAASYCANDTDPTPTITGLGGGTFSSTGGLSLNAGSGAIDVSASTPGTYTVTYTTIGTCPNSSGVSVTINALDDASFSYSAASYCANGSDPTPTITGLGGGTFSSAAGLSLNASSGTIDVSASTPGTYTVTYTTIGTCPNSSGVSVTINALDDASFSYSAASYCANGSDPTPTITGLGGGTFSSAAGLSLNASSGTIDVSASTPGTYTVTYTTIGTCPNSSGVSVTINALDDASFSYSAASYCSNDTDPTPTITGLGGGTFSSIGGLSLNASSGAIDVSASTPGTYTVTYTTAGSCPNSSGVSVTINAVDDASFSYAAAAYCPSGSDPTPTITGLGGGTFSSTAGLTINASSGLIDLSASTSGSYTVTYTTVGSCPNSSNVSVDIDITNPTAVCQNITVFLDGTGNATITAADIDGGSTDNCSAVTLSASTTSFNCSDIGTNNVTLTVTDASSNSSNCIAVVTVSDSTSPTAVCQNINVYLDGAGNATIVAADIDGGSTDNCGSVTLSASTTAFTCADLGTNNVTLTVTDGSSNTSTCVGVVTIQDTISPVITCPGNQTENPDASCNFTLPDYTSLGSATDNCGGTPTITQTPAATTVISGTTTITLTADDGNGNTSTCIFDVILNDGTAPIAVCQNITVYLDGAGNASIAGADLDGGSTDNCSGITFTATQTAFTCADLGANNVTMTATDGNSNTDNCVAVVTVMDTIAPSAVCQNINAYLDGAGNVAIAAADIDGGSTDNCSTVTLSASVTSFTCAELGANNVTLTVTDGSSNVSVCAAVVTVIDTTSPTMVCQNINAYLDGTGNVSFVAADLDGGSTDNCGGAVALSASTTAFSCSDLGPNNVSLIGTDANSNASSCVAVVTVIDTVSPSAVCQNINAYLDGAGNVTIVAADLDGGSTDNCGTVALSASTTAFTCADLGTNNVTLTVTDGSSNTNTCVGVVTIQDTISPVITCPGNQTENPDASCNFTLPDYTSLGSATDNCGGTPTITQTPAATTVISGTTTITLTADDGNGNTSTCIFDVILNDGTAPIAVCQNITVYLDGAGNASIAGADLDGGSTDNCSGITFTATQTAFTCADLGANNVTMTATDGNSNTDNCVAVVTVMDTIAPIITCPGNQTEAGDASCQGTLSDYTGLTTAVDVCDATPTVTQSPAAGTTFTGTETVWLYGTDASGNIDSCSIDVDVTDITPPTITCPADQNVDFSATCDYTLLDYTALTTTADNCGSVTVTQAPASGTIVTATTSVTLYANDGNGNIDSCAFNVIPADNTAPSITCLADQNVSLSASCDYTLLDYTTLTTTADNCSSTITVTQSPASGTIITSIITVWMYADDGNGNIDSCSFNVAPFDSIAPIATCQDITVYLDATGNVTIAASDIDGGSTDECGVPTLTVSQSSFSCLDMGVNAVTLFASDVMGNIDSCLSNVTVMDTITPTIVCPGDQNVSFASTCDYTLLDYSALVTVTENCTATITQSPITGTVITAATVVTLTVDDGNGNNATCSFNVIPTDNDAPVVTCPLDETIILDANCEVLMPDYTLTSTITDNCDATPTVVQTPAAGTMYNAEGTVDVTIVVTDTSGNVDSCSMLVTIAIDAASGCNTDIIVSDLMSPNGDGKNDFWIIHDPVDIAGCDVMVYNRWGQQVFSSNNYDNTWDGTYQGEPLPDGSYYYVIQCDGELKEKGALTILRLKK